MIYVLFIAIYYFQHLLLHTTAASSLLFTLNDLRYSLSDRILTIPKIGAIRGIHIDYENDYFDRFNLVNVEAYLGIQYGLYHGRFEPSKEKFDLYPTTKVNKQIQYGPACAQYLWNNTDELNRIRTKEFAEEYYPKLLKYIEDQNEDECLYMNIYQPQIKDIQERLPVLLFIHGDGYDMGTGAAFDGSIFASYTKTIVVTINYRLGPFGFLYVSKDNPGNYALQDIYTALHWLKNHISHFNGDSNRITLYGTGSGAVLASLVVMLETVNGGIGTIKRRKSLVHRLILNDQTFLSPFTTTTYEEISTIQSEIFTSLICSTPSCLRNKTLITTNDLLQLNLYSSIHKYRRCLICPLESPFPFYHSKMLRMNFYQQSHLFLPENLHILLTTSSSIIRSTIPLSIDATHRHISNIIEYLFNYAYTKWNRTSNQFDFDQQIFNYHQQIIAPLLEYAKYISNHRSIHILERLSKNYSSELPFTFGYVLAPSLSVFNDTYLNADEIDRRESMEIMDLFANLIHNGDINRQSPYRRRNSDETNEKFMPIFPELNFLILKDGSLTQKTGHYTHVHYLFNNLISNLSNQPFTIDLLDTWRSLYEVSYHNNTTTASSLSIIQSSYSSKSIKSNMKHPKYVFIITFTILLVFILNLFICLIMIKLGHCHRKREYNCLNSHPQLTMTKPLEQQQQRGSSSPTSTNSNATITHHLMVHTNCTTTNSSLSSTPPVDILHPINIIKKNDILRDTSMKKTSFLPEAIV